MSGTYHFQVTDKNLDLLHYSRSCEEPKTGEDPCRVELFLAERSDKPRVHSAHIQTGDKKETKTRTQNDPGDDSFWDMAQRKMDAAYRIYQNLLGGLGSALRSGTYDPETKTFVNGDQKIALQCKADKDNIIKELTLANPKHGHLFETTSSDDLLFLQAFQGVLKCSGEE